MILINPDEKKRIIRIRILNEVSAYFRTHHKGIPMQVLAGKYARALRDVFPVPEFLVALQEEGAIRVEVAIGGQRTVFPGEPVDRARTAAPSVGMRSLQRSEAEVKRILVKIDPKDWF